MRIVSTLLAVEALTASAMSIARVLPAGQSCHSYKVRLD
jgi:hypothetical protein